ncbi:MAG: 2,3-diketo-5-methylthio-1-phosphopentane phosphatase [Candidatus Lambdaproteobacteria bacterium RIFOXYD1_FULL_56_27]|uniref:Enolase-phosphatase E1 n=1 Tax=Candidatus Lambdaproteobacteria bacterium RIFOXYD2_FULL_56_26 TaxID=1817773 RepID=A0A1F6GRU1_9PROT|nr:MAG: 2,3-diketo-5-methylthio-1-phosphopentane phosphatase [Candidatus Lambdaproteobacteria bacterium RIFOXYC1_FULL_56_13]OGH00711.1 MAG: 2,3-diketo-5-methylthio-1-phosphopentane phosphatase [Candidatus Lambdaproteobacteria bacterium RIFOXYD2_FULL_56_26]OGH07878.1 MAG: 2,3-diketo-5-methylthio-1-phosphopentane phosphatase [Candidatus Lambdaproteobacteria bacterium RIFOXYD1_FULL_56_27]
MKVDYVLMDIEGTTSSLTFVHQVLFPYSLERMGAFLAAKGTEPQVSGLLEQLKAEVWPGQETQKNLTDLEKLLAEWAKADKKHPVLKALQGLVWEEGYKQGHLKGHVYPEVPGVLEGWKKEGLQLGIYSSGSVLAQKLLFGHSLAGDLTPLLSHHFDTAVGGKREVTSYQKIIEEIGFPAPQVLFLSDTKEELAAAQKAGFQVTQLFRTSPAQPEGPWPGVQEFGQISPSRS